MDVLYCDALKDIRLCASEAFCAKSESVLKAYLDKQVESGRISPAERKAVGRQRPVEGFGMIYTQRRAER